MVGRTPSSRPAWATAAPWFPVLAATTSEMAPAALRADSAYMTTRTLNDPVGSCDSSLIYVASAAAQRGGPNERGRREVCGKDTLGVAQTLELDGHAYGLYTLLPRPTPRLSLRPSCRKIRMGFLLF